MEVMESSNRKQRKVVDIQAKKRIIELGEQGQSHKAIANMFGIGRSTVTKILLNKEKLLKRDTTTGSKRSRRSNIDKELENRLYSWCIQDVYINQQSYTLVREGISKENIINKANEIAIELDLNQFDATCKWLDKFLEKHKLTINTNETLMDTKILQSNQGTKLDTRIMQCNLSENVALSESIKSRSDKEETSNKEQDLKDYLFGHYFKSNDTYSVCPTLTYDYNVDYNLSLDYASNYNCNFNIPFPNPFNH